MMNTNQAENQKTKKEPLIHSIYDFLELFVIAVCIVFVIFTFTLRLCLVDGRSMEKTLSNGERLLTTNFFYTPTAGDIIVFHQTNENIPDHNKLFVKRIIATEGQFVKVTSNGVYVSDDAIFEESDRLDESQYAYLDSGIIEDNFHNLGEVFEVPEGHIFVLGDNRNNSTDSRASSVGFVDVRRVIGKVLLRITPFDRFGTVN